MACSLQTHFPLATATLLCLFLFVVTVMLFNVLIALLTNASQKVRHSCAWCRPASHHAKMGLTCTAAALFLLSSALAVTLLGLAIGFRGYISPDSPWRGR